MILYTVIPCYNEEEVLPKSKQILVDKYVSLIEQGLISSESRILMVDDGSKDKTWELIKACHEENPFFCGVKLSRNKGHQNAVFAGLMEAVKYADAMVSIDADLQDDVNAIDEMIRKYNNGTDIVYGVRSERKTDSFIKRFTADFYYTIMRLFGANIIYNHADFRLMSKRAVKALGEFEEVNLFLRGIVPMIGFKTDTVFYQRQKRLAGKSKYTLLKMIDLAWNGITSFSTRPIDIVLGAGVLIFGVSAIAMLILLIMSTTGKEINSAAWIITSIFLATGMNLGALGVVGEYVGKAYIETKKRPKYFIEEII